MARVVYVIGVLASVFPVGSVLAAVFPMSGARGGGVCGMRGVRIVSGVHVVSGVSVSGGRRIGVVLVMLGVLIVLVLVLVFVCGLCSHTLSVLLTPTPWGVGYTPSDKL